MLRASEDQRPLRGFQAVLGPRRSSTSPMNKLPGRNGRRVTHGCSLPRSPGKAVGGSWMTGGIRSDCAPISTAAHIHRGPAPWRLGNHTIGLRHHGSGASPSPRRWMKLWWSGEGSFRFEWPSMQILC